MSTMTAPPRLRHKSAMLNLFVSPKEISRLRADLQKRQDRKAAALPSTTSAKPAAPAEAPAPAPAPAPEPAPAPQAPTSSAPAQAEPASSADKKAWTTAEDIALLQLRKEGKTFAEIATTLAPRSEAEAEARHKEIGLPADNVAGPSAPAAEPVKPAGAKDDKRQQKGKQRNERKKRGKGKDNQPRQDSKPAGTVASADDVPSDPFTDAAGAAAAESEKKDEAVIASKVDMKIKGVLKRGANGNFAIGSGNMGVPAGATSFMGRPIIYLEEHDPLGNDELSTLYQMHMVFEEQRWIRMASKFFDQTGKRIEPEWLKQKFGHIRP
ncbi:MAG: hypothetical protein Q9200_004312 [Gallowayella weberi]